MNLGVNFWNPSSEAIPLDPKFGEVFQGFLLAWDPVAQEEVWRFPHSQSVNGGVLVTAGDLVFQGNGDEIFAAYAADTGKLLWSAPTQTGVVAPPVTYSVDGEQYVAVVVGWGGVSPNFLGFAMNADGKRQSIGRVLAFKLGGDAELSPRPAGRGAMPAFEEFGTDEQIALGRDHYGRYCAVCHGVVAISGGVMPDLRYSPVTSSADAFRSIVLDGTLQDKGMASFAEVLSADDAEAVRAYIIGEANRKPQ